MVLAQAVTPKRPSNLVPSNYDFTNTHQRYKLLLPSVRLTTYSIVRFFQVARMSRATFTS
jgi:hypothetical protein